MAHRTMLTSVKKGADWPARFSGRLWGKASKMAGLGPPIIVLAISCFYVPISLFTLGGLCWDIVFLGGPMAVDRAPRLTLLPVIALADTKRKNH